MMHSRGPKYLIDVTKKCMAIYDGVASQSEKEFRLANFSPGGWGKDPVPRNSV
jgi:hypothetical protein